MGNTKQHSEEEVYQFIQAFILRHGYAPTLREIMDGTSLGSISSASAYVDALVSQGKLKRDKKVARGIVLLGLS